METLKNSETSLLNMISHNNQGPPQNLSASLQELEEEIRKAQSLKENEW